MLSKACGARAVFSSLPSERVYQDVFFHIPILSAYSVFGYFRQSMTSSVATSSLDVCVHARCCGCPRAHPPWHPTNLPHHQYVTSIFVPLISCIARAFTFADARTPTIYTKHDFG